MNKSLSKSQQKRAIFEAKHVSAFANEDEIKARYFPQVQHCMYVCGYEKAYLSVFFGTLKWKVFEIDAEPMYQAQLIEAERKFWDCVQSGEPPVAVHVPAPVEAIRSIDMAGNNAWASAAADWLSNKLQASKFDKAAKTIKELVEADVVEAFGHGIRASRSKAGAISIREVK